MKDNIKISNAVIKRMPRYRRYLSDLNKKGVDKDVKDGIHSIKAETDKITAVLANGNYTVRPDILLNALEIDYNKIVKTKQFILKDGALVDADIIF